MTYNDSPEGLLELLKTTKSEQGKGQFRVKPHWWSKSAYCCLGVEAKALENLGDKKQPNFMVLDSEPVPSMQGKQATLPSDHWLRKPVTVTDSDYFNGENPLEAILANINDNSYDDGCRHFERVIAFLEDYIKYGLEKMTITRKDGPYYGRVNWVVNDD